MMANAVKSTEIIIDMKYAYIIYLSKPYNAIDFK